MATPVLVPNIGDFKDVAVIEILVKPGDTIQSGQSLITVESDKASMEVPSAIAGVVKTVHIKLGDKVSEGSLMIDVDASTEIMPVQTPPSIPAAQPPVTKAETVTPVTSQGASYDCDTLVIGAGPGGYTAAFRAADLGQKVILVERFPTLGGVCLNVGCIPSKALLHSAKVLAEAEEMHAHGIQFGKPSINLDQLRNWKNSVVTKLTGGLSGLAKARNVRVVQGTAKFIDAHRVVVVSDKEQVLSFKHCIIAAGSTPVVIPGFPKDDPRLWDSTDALTLPFIPKSLLVVGGGIIGLEMACVYHSLGSKITVVEFSDSLIPAADKDLVTVLQNRIKKQYEIYTSTKVTGITAQKEGLLATFEGGSAPKSQLFDAVLVAVGRRPNGALLEAEKAGVVVNERGFIHVNHQQRTNIEHIFAIGDICGDPMLAHKATTEAKVAAEVIAGHKVAFEAATIPSVAYTDPEIAWMGLTEREAIAKNIPYAKGSFPWAASGRALAMARAEGITKVIYAPETKKILGVGIVGNNAGELLAESVLALEMGADLEDVALTIHAHPTLSETLAFASEMALGTITDLMPPKKK